MRLQAVSRSARTGQEASARPLGNSAASAASTLRKQSGSLTPAPLPVFSTTTSLIPFACPNATLASRSAQ